MSRVLNDLGRSWTSGNVVLSDWATAFGQVLREVIEEFLRRRSVPPQLVWR